MLYQPYCLVNIGNSLRDRVKQKAVFVLQLALPFNLPKCALKGSNLGPFEYQSNALPTELSAHFGNFLAETNSLTILPKTKQLSN